MEEESMWDSPPTSNNRIKECRTEKAKR